MLIVFSSFFARHSRQFKDLALSSKMLLPVCSFTFTWDRVSGLVHLHQLDDKESIYNEVHSQTVPLERRSWCGKEIVTVSGRERVQTLGYPLTSAQTTNNSTKCM